MKRAWTRAEKWLFATPLLFGIAALAVSIGPGVVRKMRGYPTELPITPGTVVTAISLSADGRLLAAGGRIDSMRAKNKSINFWDARTLKPLPSLTRPVGRSVDPFSKKTYHEFLTTAVALSPDAQTLAWGSNATGLTVTDLKTRRPLWSAKGYVKTASYSPDGRWLAFNPGNRWFRIVDSRTGKNVTQWEHRDYNDDTHQFSPQGHLFASIAATPFWLEWTKARNERGGEIEVRRTSDWKIERVLPLPNTSVLAFSPDEQSIVGVGKLYRKPYSSMIEPKAIPIRCYNVSTGEVKWELDAQDPHLNPPIQSALDLCYSPDGASIAVLTSGPQLILLDANTGVCTRTLPMPGDTSLYSLPHGLVFSPDGKRLFARGRHAVLVWDLK
jgi:WD40 repeat protein